MNQLDSAKLKNFISENFSILYKIQNKPLQELKFERLLNKNPYLLRIKYIPSAGELVSKLLAAYISSTEEKLLGDFLKDLAIFITEMTSGGYKSAAPGVDLEFIDNGFHYLVSVKSGPHWGNSSQQNKLERDL